MDINYFQQLKKLKEKIDGRNLCECGESAAKLIEEFNKKVDEMNDSKSGLNIGGCVGNTYITYLANEYMGYPERDDDGDGSRARRYAFIDGYKKRLSEEDGEALLYAVNKTVERTKREMIAKAAEWFEKYLFDIGYPDDWLRDSPNIVGGKKRFIKAMEK